MMRGRLLRLAEESSQHQLVQKQQQGESQIVWIPGGYKVD
jgi:hypothetical protein